MRGERRNLPNLFDEATNCHQRAATALDELFNQSNLMDQAQTVAVADLDSDLPKDAGPGLQRFLIT